MENLICNHKDLPSYLANNIFTDRRRQFVDRLQWNLCLTANGNEVDEYDDENSQYLIVHKKGHHIGSCRVRPTTSPTMITDHFLDSFPEATDLLKMQKGRIYELTRFCRSPDISAEQSKEMLIKIGTLMDQYRDQQNLTGFIAVVFPTVARFMDAIGMRYILLSKSVIGDQKAYLICITHGAPEKLKATKRAAATAPRRFPDMIAA